MEPTRARSGPASLPWAQAQARSKDVGDAGGTRSVQRKIEQSAEEGFRGRRKLRGLRAAASEDRDFTWPMPTVMNGGGGREAAQEGASRRHHGVTGSSCHTDPHSLGQTPPNQFIGRAPFGTQLRYATLNRRVVLILPVFITAPNRTNASRETKVGEG